MTRRWPRPTTPAHASKAHSARRARTKFTLLRVGLVTTLTLVLNVVIATAVSASGVSALTAIAKPTTPGAAASYAISYTPASTQTIFNTISVEAAPGTTFTACSTCSGYYSLVQGTSTESIMGVSVQVAGGSATPNEFVISLGFDLIWGNMPVTIVALGTNPTAPGSETLMLWTSTDTTPDSVSYPIGAPATNSLLEGAYSNNQGANSPAFVQSLFGIPTGTTPDLGSEYLSGGTWSQLEGANGALAYLQSVENWSTPLNKPTPGTQPVFAVAMFPTQGCWPACTLADGADPAYYQANYATYWKGLATQLVGMGLGNAWLRLGWEFDNNVAPYSLWGIGTDKTAAANFAAYWRNIVTTMRAVSGANFRFVWNPEAIAFLGPKDPEYASTGQGPDLTDAWPGSGYVDYIGLDLYDQMGWATGTDTWSTYIEPQLSAAETFASQIGGGTALGFPEWGVCAPELFAMEFCQGDDPTYINNMYCFMTTASNNVAWENYVNLNIFGFDSAITGGGFPQSLAAFQADFGRRSLNCSG